MLAGKGTQILKNLRDKLKQNGLNAFLLFHGDAHQSEYLAECDERIGFLSGFTGSNGICLVTQDDNEAEEMALMWTDGRYYLQAGKQLHEGWKMMQIEAGVPHYSQWICDNIKGGTKIGCDEQQIPSKIFDIRSEMMAKKDIQLIPGANLVDEIWENRPSMPSEPVWVLADQYTGESVLEKYERVGAKLDGADMMIISTLDDIAWFMNLRGSDISYNPLFFSYLIFHNQKGDKPFSVDLFLNKNKVAEPEVAAHLQKNNVTLYEYEQLQEKLTEYGASMDSKKIVVDSGNLNYFLSSTLKNQGFELDDSKDNICEVLKAEKNKVQMEGMRQANIRACAAIMKYFAFLEEELQKEGHGLNEFTGAMKLQEFYSQGDLYKGQSFESISSMGPNGAVIHYSPTAEENLPLNTDEIYLLDSGCQYLDGTTDITRCTHFGGKPPTDFQKETYTRVLLGTLDLEKVIWPKGRGFAGKDFDILARKHLFEAGLDYKHGTGHGVGSMLCVHEGPQGVNRRTTVEFKEGMCVSDEPGYYQDGEFGFRIENVIMVIQHPQYEDRLMFENLTVAPYDRNLLDLSIISDEYLDMINKHHAKCRDSLSPLLEGDLRTKTYVEKLCAPIIR